MSMDHALQTFIAESRDLLVQMEHELLHMDHAAATDMEAVNAIFRAAHTIKGGAGVFGFDAVVAFTHVAESVLEKLRNGVLSFDSNMVALLLLVCDHIGVLVDLAVSRAEIGEPIRSDGANLINQLQAFLEDEGPQATPPVCDMAQASAFERSGVSEVTSDNWHISVRFAANALRDGMDPLVTLRYLTSFGRIVNIVTLTEAVPRIAELEADTCYLGFEIAFASAADKALIEDAFEFVRENGFVRILPPRGKVSQYVELIEALPEQEMRLGEMLVRCGTLTEAELERVLQEQLKSSGHGQQPLGQVLLEQQIVHPPVIEAALEKQQRAKESRSAEQNSIRVEVAKLDQHINLIGELIIASAGLAAQSGRIPALKEAAATLWRLVEDVRDSALKLRMVQIGATFNRFRRVVFDVSKELGKEIELVIRGADTELDKTVVEKIGDPLTHLIRNAMDHGIESAAVRIAAGKPLAGSVQLNAYHDAGSIVIEVSDDGAGLNREKILRKAVQRGLIVEGQLLSDAEIFNLVFEPGFSTAEQVSNLSGRGVGMDVVKRNIQALRGTVDLSSVVGQGTTVRIRLPLTLAIIDGFLVEVGSSAYVIPLDMVIECIELPRSAATAGGRCDYVDLRGEVLPLIRLRDMFDVGEAASRRENVVVVRCAGQRTGLVVDRLKGEFQTVIKPLGKVFRLIKGIGGFTILGNGDVALILDVPGLVQQVIRERQSEAAPPPMLHGQHLTRSG